MIFNIISVIFTLVIVYGIHNVFAIIGKEV